jgi:hypothetical protein
VFAWLFFAFVIASSVAAGAVALAVKAVQWVIN